MQIHGSGCPVSWHQKKVFSNQAEAGDDVDIEENTLVVGPGHATQLRGACMCIAIRAAVGRTIQSYQHQMAT